MTLYETEKKSKNVIKSGLLACWKNLVSSQSQLSLIFKVRFYENEELIAITKELADTLRRNKTIDWQKRESARAKMRMLIKKLLKKHKYPPEGMEDAVQTVMTQCELWTDNNDMGEEKVVNFRDKSISYAEANYVPMKVAESTATYETKK